MTRRELAGTVIGAAAALAEAGETCAVAEQTSSFADEVAASLPAEIKLPAELRAALAWCESAGCVHAYSNSGKRYAFVYPGEFEWHEGRSVVTFQSRDADYVRHWTLGKESAAARLAPIVRTGGDGSHAALWIDDDGRLKIVHIGSGSGSTVLGVLCDRPVDLLRLMAIGYEELCWQENWLKTPEQAFLESSQFQRPGKIVRPVAFRRFVESEFGVGVPDRASDILTRRVAQMGETTNDPFARWIASLER